MESLKFSKSYAGDYRTIDKRLPGSSKYPAEGFVVRFSRKAGYCGGVWRMAGTIAAKEL